MNPEQRLLYLQAVLVILGNMPADTPDDRALAIAKRRAAAFLQDPELFPAQEPS